jgi:hypothetical protein
MSRLIKLRLGNAPFWFLGSNLRLDFSNNETKYLDFDALNETQRQAINVSSKLLEIKVFDIENNRIRDLDTLSNHTKTVEFLYDDVEDNDFPEISCVTVSEQEKEEKLVLPSNEDEENAKILLSNKLGVIKKTIENIDDPVLLRAMLDAEEQGKQRKQIISMLEEKL